MVCKTLTVCNITGIGALTLIFEGGLYHRLKSKATKKAAFSIAGVRITGRVARTFQ